LFESGVVRDLFQIQQSTALAKDKTRGQNIDMVGEEKFEMDKTPKAVGMKSICIHSPPYPCRGKHIRKKSLFNEGSAAVSCRYALKFCSFVPLFVFLFD
jgi:hypothetical protein